MQYGAWTRFLSDVRRIGCVVGNVVRACTNAPLVTNSCRPPSNVPVQCRDPIWRASCTVRPSSNRRFLTDRRSHHFSNTSCRRWWRSSSSCRPYDVSKRELSLHSTASTPQDSSVRLIHAILRSRDGPSNVPIFIFLQICVILLFFLSIVCQLYPSCGHFELPLSTDTIVSVMARGCGNM